MTKTISELVAIGEGWRPITDITDDNVIPHSASFEIKRIGDIDYFRIIGKD